MYVYNAILQNIDTIISEDFFKLKVTEKNGLALTNLHSVIQRLYCIYIIYIYIYFGMPKKSFLSFFIFVFLSRSFLFLAFACSH